MSDEKIITKEDLLMLKDAKTKAAFLALKAEKAYIEAQVAELEKKNCVLNIYVKYGLTPDDIIDESNGTVKQQSAQEIDNNDK